jgi:hypothetical protein
MIGVLIIIGLLVAASTAIWRGWRPSEALRGSMQREFDPTPEQEASQFYRRGQKYNSIGGLKGVHSGALVWQIIGRRAAVDRLRPIGGVEGLIGAMKSQASGR